MTSFPAGLYEALVTEALAARLERLPPDRHPSTQSLRTAEAADRIAWHIASVVERAIEMLPESERTAAGVELARALVDRVVEGAAVAELRDERPLDAANVLRGIHRLHPDGQPVSIDAPLIPLLDSALLTNSPGEPAVGHQVAAEIASADRIDLIMAFIRRTGIKPMRDRLRRHVENGGRLRVLTTTYTGSTEAAALDWLEALGAEVRVSYDTASTRLHAKAWLFHRDSGFSTAYVGSSNLTHSAQVAGLEWNVRISGARNRPIIEKVAAVFESYWEEADFEPYDRERFSIAVDRDRPTRERLILSPTEIRAYPFQERLLELIELSRERGYSRNLLVAATGTGKTVMAALDYQRLRKRLPRARLLFVAHREEILTQSQATFAHALRDANFGELWVGGQRPADFDHVFASIQSLNASGVEAIPPDHFDVVIIDEFHHAAASSYRALLDHLEPVQLLGLTATPERSDGLPVLHWFDDRIAAELRLWDAIDQHRLTPFAYYGIADELDLREIPWRRGRGYDERALTDVITANDVWARYVLKQLVEHFGDPPVVRALGFCVSVDHAHYMARVFNDHGVPAVAVTGDTRDFERKRALRDLERGSVSVVFSVDLFNEGVDVPRVDALLMLRPTESPLLFLQQLGRGLRKAEGKAVCTVLDFVGHHRQEFRYDRRFRSLLGGSRTDVIRQVEQGFPFLPAGCHMELDRLASERVLTSIRNALPRTITERARELRELAAHRGGVTLKQFLDATGLDLDDVYAGNYSWSDLRERADLQDTPSGDHEESLRRACGRLLHVDDPERLAVWRRWLQRDIPPDVGVSKRNDRLLRMLLGQLLDQVASKDVGLREGAALLWTHPQVRRELDELFEVLEDRVSHLTPELEILSDVPLHVHARYTRIEILAACGKGEGARVMPWQTGVMYLEELPADLFAFTLDKTTGGFSPTTRYRDYAISRDLIHWESQSVTRADSETGQRYQKHAPRGSHILLFARLNTNERAFHFLGPATYVRHEGEQPMAITWKLEYRLPGDLYQSFAAAVA
jgi:superfamily II DNA or RNA helicase/HKD family nuclease